MKFQNGDDFLLENIVCEILECDKHGMGGIANGNALLDDPLLAAIICVTRLYSGRHDKEIGKFFDKWRTIFKFPNENRNYTCEQYINELYGLIRLLSQ